MPRTSENLEKVTIRLYDGDFARLKDFYPKANPNLIIRTLVHRHIKTLEERENASSQVNLPDISIDVPTDE